MAALIQFAVFLDTDDQELIESFALRARADLWQINRTSLDAHNFTTEEMSEYVVIYEPSISYALDLDVPELQTPDRP